MSAVVPRVEKRDVAVSRWWCGKGREDAGGSWIAVCECEIWAWIVGRARRMWRVGLFWGGVDKRVLDREVVERPAITLITNFPAWLLELGGCEWKAEAMEGMLRSEVTCEGSTARRITLECWIAWVMERVERARDSFFEAMCWAKRVLRRDSDATEDMQAV